MKVRWSSEARDDLRALYLHIAQDDPSAARKVVTKLRAVTSRIGTSPWAGRVVPEFEVAELRERIVRPYRVVYLVRAEAVLIVRVWHPRPNMGAAQQP